MDLSATQLWLGIGIALIILELVTTTFVVLFFGVAAFVVALASFLGVGSMTVQLLLFAIVGAAGIVLFRGKVRSAYGGSKEHNKFDGLENEEITLSCDVPAGGRASVMHQGVPWTALNETEQTMKAGEVVLIARVDGVKLILARLPASVN